MRRHAALLVSLTVSVAAIAVALTYVDLGALQADLGALSPPLVLVGLGVLGLNYWLRAWRFRLLLQPDAKHARGLFAVVCLYATLNYLLPARLGEVSLPVLLNRVSGQQYSVGTASLIAARALDLFAVAALFPFALLASHAALPPWTIHAAVIFMAFTLSGVTGLLWYLHRRSVRAPQTRYAHAGLLQRVAAFGMRVRDQLSLMVRQGVLVWATVLSLGIWLCIALNFYVILAAAGLDVPFIAAFLVTIVMIPLSFIPAQGFANLGTHEAAWLVVLVAMGFAPELAARATLLSHLVLVGYVLVIGVLGWMLILRKQGRPANARR